MGSGAMIYVPSFIKIGSGVQKLIGGIHRHTQRNTHARTHGQQFHKPTLFFQNKESRLKMYTARLLENNSICRIFIEPDPTENRSVARLCPAEWYAVFELRRSDVSLQYSAKIMEICGSTRNKRIIYSWRNRRWNMFHYRPNGWRESQ
jgi:hypothetical protein